MSNVSPLSGISGLSFDSTLLSSFLFFFFFWGGRGLNTKFHIFLWGVPSMAVQQIGRNNSVAIQILLSQWICGGNINNHNYMVSCLHFNITLTYYPSFFH